MLKRLNRRSTLFPALVLVLVLAVLAGYFWGRNQPGDKAQNVAQEPPKVSSDIPADEPVARVAAQVSPSVVQVNIQAVPPTPLRVQKGRGGGCGVIYPQKRH